MFAVFDQETRGGRTMGQRRQGMVLRRVLCRYRGVRGTVAGPQWPAVSYKLTLVCTNTAIEETGHTATKSEMCVPALLEFEHFFANENLCNGKRVFGLCNSHRRRPFLSMFLAAQVEHLHITDNRRLKIRGTECVTIACSSGRVRSFKSISSDFNSHPTSCSHLHTTVHKSESWKKSRSDDEL